MPTKRILFISDSRGRNIEPLLREHTPLGIDITWDVQILPGAGIESILKRVERGLRRNSWNQIIVNAGICNLTKRITKEGQKCIEYKVRNVDNVCSTIDQMIDALGGKVTICTITPAILEKYSNVRETDPEIKIEQDHLDEDITTINSHIKRRNIERDTATIDLAKLSEIRSLKRQGKTKKRIVKLNPNCLRDGVHPTLELLESWAKYTTKMAVKILNLQIPAEDASTEDSEDSDTGNFKRQRTNRT